MEHYKSKKFFILYKKKPKCAKEDLKKDLKNGAELNTTMRKSTRNLKQEEKKRASKESTQPVSYRKKKILMSINLQTISGTKEIMN